MRGGRVSGACGAFPTGSGRFCITGSGSTRLARWLSCRGSRQSALRADWGIVFAHIFSVRGSWFRWWLFRPGRRAGRSFKSTQKRVSIAAAGSRSRVGCPQTTDVVFGPRGSSLVATLAQTGTGSACSSRLPALTRFTSLKPFGAVTYGMTRTCTAPGGQQGSRPPTTFRRLLGTLGRILWIDVTLLGNLFTSLGIRNLVAFRFRIGVHRSHVLRSDNGLPPSPFLLSERAFVLTITLKTTN